VLFLQAILYISGPFLAVFLFATLYTSVGPLILEDGRFSLGDRVAYRKEYSRLRKAATGFTVSLIIYITCAFTFDGVVRWEVNSFLDGYEPAKYSVYVNDTLINDPWELIEGMRTRKRVRLRHHSHGEHEIGIKVVGKEDSLILNLERDSNAENEYWLFYPKYKFSAGNNFERVIIKGLERY
jgi:hypothetical protein